MIKMVQSKKLSKNLILIIYFFSITLSAQINKVIVKDLMDKKPIYGIKFFSENGSLVGCSDLNGEFEIDKSILKLSNINSLMINEFDYAPIVYKIEEIPKVIFLEKVKINKLDEVVIVKKLSEKYFTIKGYLRSWKLINNKLVKYGDALLEFHIPYENTNNDFNTGIKNYALQYRTFRIDSIKQKSRIISIGQDSFLDSFIPNRDLLTRGSKRYKTEQKNDSLYSIFEENKNIGYAIKSKLNVVNEVKISEKYEGKEALKLLFWKFSGGYEGFEKWTTNNQTRHLSYLFSNEKTIIETRIKAKYNAIETINEIFIDDKIIYNDKKPIKSKKFIDKDRSYYNINYWKEEMKKHPLPKSIENQLLNINENKNNY